MVTDCIRLFDCWLKKKKTQRFAAHTVFIKDQNIPLGLQSGIWSQSTNSCLCIHVYIFQSLMSGTAQSLIAPVSSSLRSSNFADSRIYDTDIMWHSCWLPRKKRRSASHVQYNKFSSGGLGQTALKTREACEGFHFHLNGDGKTNMSWMKE